MNRYGPFLSQFQEAEHWYTFQNRFFHHGLYQLPVAGSLDRKENMEDDKRALLQIMMRFINQFVRQYIGL